MSKRSVAVFLALFAGLAVAADKVFSPPPAAHAKTYPRVEAHDDEQVSIAVDPFDGPGKASLFHVNYKENQFLVLRLIISNDGSKALMLDSLRVEYVTAGHDKLSPATKDDVLRRLSHPTRAGTQPRVQLPIPTQRKGPPAVSQQTREEVDSAMFVNVPVTPHSTNSGFLFFDVRDIDNPKAGAHLYISGIKAGSQELFYFDIPLEAPAPGTPSNP